jgi:hypothetical protein
MEAKKSDGKKKVKSEMVASIDHTQMFKRINSM